MKRRRGTALAFLMASACVAGAPGDWTHLAAMSIDRMINIAESTSYRQVGARDVGRALRAASAATGVDFAYLAANASLESSLDPSARAKTSSAAGLFQFIESTWAGMVERHGAKIGLGKEAAALAGGDLSGAERRRIMNLRFDAGVAARMGAEFAAENAGHLRNGLGREPEDVDLYLAHFLGAGGAVKFLKGLDAAPAAAAASAFPAAAKANPAVFYDGGKALSFADIRDRFDAKLDRAKGAPVPAASPATRSVSVSPPPAAGLPGLASAPPPGGDPWLTTLVNAQLSMNDALTQVSRADDASARAYRDVTA